MTGLTPLRARGLLADFAAAGVLAPADVHVAARLGVLGGESDDRVLLAAALVVRSTRLGSVVLDLADAALVVAARSGDEDGGETGDVGAGDLGVGGVGVGGEAAAAVPDLPWPAVPDWVAACVASRLTDHAAPGGAPLRQHGSRLWLDRYWRQEAQVARDLLERLDPHQGPPQPAADDGYARPTDEPPAAGSRSARALEADLDALFPDPADADQQAAARLAVERRLTVVVGGPGTGKTTTVARIVALLLRREPGIRVALAAPTGKAAARLTDAVHAAAGPLTPADRAGLGGLQAVTVHRLLGRRPGATSRFRHDRTTRLPYDVVVVDECSMVSLTLMARLLEALADPARLILVGDPDQLASVEAGAVLGDLVSDADPGPDPDPDVDSDANAPLPGAVAVLRTLHRFDTGSRIAELAGHVRAGRAADALALLTSGVDGLGFHAAADGQPLDRDALAAVRATIGYEQAVVGAAEDGDAAGALAAVDRHRLLCAHRTGPRGVRLWNETVEGWLLAADPDLRPQLDGTHVGQPLLVTANDYDNELFNGDIGVVVRTGGDELLAAFRRRGAVVQLPLARLGAVRPMHAMTVHRAQGSQFDAVTVLLPAADSPLATRQTLYTAITRAARQVRIIGSPDAVLAAIDRPVVRATGLRDRLTGGLPVT